MRRSHRAPPICYLPLDSFLLRTGRSKFHFPNYLLAAYFYCPSHPSFQVMHAAFPCEVGDAHHAPTPVNCFMHVITCNDESQGERRDETMARNLKGE